MGRKFLLLAKFDHSAVQPIAGGAPFVFIDQLFGKDSESDVALVQSPVPEHEGLAEGGNGDRFVETWADFTDAKLQCWVDTKGAYVPPDFTGVGDAAGVRNN